MINAFLNGLLEEEVYMEQLEWFQNPGFSRHVCKFLQGYIWQQVCSKAWFDLLKFTLLNLYILASQANALIYVKVSSSTILYILINVDDIILSLVHMEFNHSSILTLNAKFSLKIFGGFELFFRHWCEASTYWWYVSQSKEICVRVIR